MQEITEKLKEKCWIPMPVSDADKAAAVQISEALSIHLTVAQLLVSRGYATVAQARAFLSMENEMLCNPFDMADMQKAIDRIAYAVKQRERITIYGDYDVDGVTAVSTLYLYLSSIGADVTYYIPNRATDGYGVICSAVQALADEGTRLIITVDTGITATEETRFAKELGVDFVITDHHECCADLPDACAVVNPHRPDCPYPFKDLAGVGVVFKLICAYEEYRSHDTRFDVARRMFAEYSDLVAIGTIADVMPIRDENRIIVCHGLRSMENCQRIGLTALMNATQQKGDKKKKTKITSGYIGYTLAPRINAAGRILCATIAVELFLAKDYERAYAIAEELCQANKDRQNEENKIIKEVAAKMESCKEIMDSPVIVLDSDTWHHGVIGIVSSRITEKYCRPSILISFEGHTGTVAGGTDIGKGSGRSIKGMNLVDALCACSDVLVKFGGHELAAGLSVTRENLPAFREKINTYAKQNLSAEDMMPTLDVDLCVNFDTLTLAFAEALQILEPYGIGNPVPLFMVEDCCVADMMGISDQKHTRFTLTDGIRTVVAMFFSTSPERTGVCISDHVDAVFTVDINEWLGRRSIQLILKDIRPCAAQQRRRQGEEDEFERIWAGGSFDEKDDVVPSRDDFARVYKCILAMLRSGKDTVSIRKLLSMLASTSNDETPPIGYCKLRIILKVFMEMNIIGMEEHGDTYVFFRQYKNTKCDLEKSTLLRRIRSQQRHV